MQFLKREINNTKHDVLNCKPPDLSPNGSPSRPLTHFHQFQSLTHVITAVYVVQLNVTFFSPFSLFPSCISVQIIFNTLSLTGHAGLETPNHDNYSPPSHPVRGLFYLRFLEIRKPDIAVYIVHFNTVFSITLNTSSVKVREQVSRLYQTTKSIYVTQVLSFISLDSNM